MPRNVLAENQTLKRHQETGIYLLGWFALAVAIVAGSYASDAWPGQAIRWVFNLAPGDWLIPLALFIWFVAWAIDIISDLTPNQPAITFGFMAPILAQGTDSRLADHVGQWSNLLQDGVGGQLSAWVGNVSAGWLGVALMAVAVIVGKRVLAKQSAAAGRAGGGPR